MSPDEKHRRPVLTKPACRWNGGYRNQEPNVIVIHTAESPWDAAEGVANYGARTDRKVSWHVVVDDEVAIRQLPDSLVSWTAPPRNSDGLHIEICGRAAASKIEWYRHQANLKRAAWIVAEWCKTHDIPARWLTDRQLDHNYAGLTTHRQVSRVYRKSDHTDPGPHFPSRYFLYLVKRRIRWL